MNISGKYLKVWDIKENNGYRKLNLGDSKKLKDDSYENWTWFDCLLVGKAKDIPVNKDDVIEVTSGLISKRKYNDKFYDDIVIFEFNVTKSAGAGNSEPVEDDSLPF